MNRRVLRLPGIIDAHVHLRDPGLREKEDFTTGTSAALAGGVVVVLDMPNNRKPIITSSALSDKEKKASSKAVCDYGFFFGTDGNNLEEFEKVKDRVFGLKIYMNQTTGLLLVSDKKKLNEIFASWPQELPILVHAEDIHVRFAIELAKVFGKRLHICHLSQRKELEWVIEAKKVGLNVTCEVTPHHLFLTDKDAQRLGPYGLMKPPLRSKKDVEFLWDHLDWVDCVATDHAPHTKEEKESAHPPYGVPGLETMLPLLLTAVSQKRLTIGDVMRLTSTNPARIFGITLDSNTYIEVDPNEEYEIKNENLKTKCAWSPFDGWKVKGKIKRVFIRGTKVFEDGEILAEPGFGKKRLVKIHRA